jgi:hypothetical protein
MIPQTLPAQPMDFDQTRRSYREKYDTGDFWLIMLDSASGFYFYREIERFAAGPKRDDNFQSFVLDHGSEDFTMIAIRKRRL